MIDIENVLVRKVHLGDSNLKLVLENKNKYADKLIVIQQCVNENCKCSNKNHSECIKENVVYQIRPYTFNFLRAIKPFFEIIVYSKLPFNTLFQIAHHIETILNKPVLDVIR